jgi:hypothetical protein
VLLAQWPVTVLMQRRRLPRRWGAEQWSALAVLPEGCEPDALDGPADDGACLQYLVPGLQLELHSDENDGYFENWIAPEPKVFVLWQLREGRAMPISVSLSYAEGARMLDSGDGADGVPMHEALHGWLGGYLQCHHRPRRSGGHRHP